MSPEEQTSQDASSLEKEPPSPQQAAAVLASFLESVSPKQAKHLLDPKQQLSLELFKELPLVPFRTNTRFYPETTVSFRIPTPNLFPTDKYDQATITFGQNNRPFEIILILQALPGRKAFLNFFLEPHQKFPPAHIEKTYLPFHYRLCLFQTEPLQINSRRYSLYIPDSEDILSFPPLPPTDRHSSNRPIFRFSRQFVTLYTSDYFQNLIHGKPPFYRTTANHPSCHRTSAKHSPPN